MEEKIRFEVHKAKGPLKIFAGVVALIVLYWAVLLTIYGSEQNAVKHDPLNKIVFRLPAFENCCSMWPISHFILFFILGVMYPECDLIIITAGILWEVVEVLIYKLLGYQRQGVRIGSERVEYSQNWWMGSSKDIIFNIVGFYSGKFLFH